MQPTKTSHLLVIVIVLGAIGWAVTVITQGQTGRALPVPTLAAAAMWIFGASFLLWTYFAKPRLQRLPGEKPFPALASARIAVLAMAASRTGAVIGGFYLGVALASISNSASPAGWSAMITAFIASFGAGLLMVSAMWLESLCVARNKGNNGPDS